MSERRKSKDSEGKIVFADFVPIDVKEAIFCTSLFLRAFVRVLQEQVVFFVYRCALFVSLSSKSSQHQSQVYHMTAPSGVDGKCRISQRVGKLASNGTDLATK